MKANATHAAESTQQNLPLSGLPDTETRKCRATALWLHPPVRTVRLPAQMYISTNVENEKTHTPHWSVGYDTTPWTYGTTQQRNNTAPWTQHHGHNTMTQPEPTTWTHGKTQQSCDVSMKAMDMLQSCRRCQASPMRQNKCVAHRHESVGEGPCSRPDKLQFQANSGRPFCKQNNLLQKLPKPSF